MKKKIGILILMLLIGSTISTTGMINEYKSYKHDSSYNNVYVPGEFIIKFKELKVSSASIDTLNEKYQIYSITKLFNNAENTNLDNIYKYKLPKDSDILEIIKEYSSLENVIYVEPNYIAHTLIIPNDEFFPIQWSLDNTGQSIWENISGTYDSDIDIPEAWDIETGSEDIIIAVIDTGIDYNHPDLIDNIWTNDDEIPDNGIDDGMNGYIDDFYGYDFNNSDGDPHDDNGHGTICSGLIGAKGDNNIGISGVCWNCKIMSVKSGNHKAQLYTDKSSEGIKYAVDNGADVLSLSYGSKYFSDLSNDAVQYAHNHGVVIVAAAGNSNTETIMYPAGYENVIAVAATNHHDERCTEEDWDPNHKMFGTQGSQYGDWIDVSAPGHLVYATLPTYEVTRNNMENLQIGGYYPLEYWYLAGTSVSCPIVAGLIGLLLSQDPKLTNDDVKKIIRANVDPYISDEYIGTGRVNAYKVLTRDNTQPDKPKINGPTNGKPDNKYTFTVSCNDPEGDNLFYMWDWGDGNFSEWIENNEASYIWNQEDNFNISVMAKDIHGATSEWSDPFKFSTPKNKLSNLLCLLMEWFLQRFPILEFLI